MKKISILGDVMTEPDLLAEVKQKDGSYDYLPVFAALKGALASSDLVLANLETPVAGEARGYSETIFSFNAPETLVTALQEIGVDAVSTANNHAMDRGGAGFYATLDALDRLGMPHTGTYKKSGEANRNLYLTAGDLTVAVIAYTYGVNGFISSGGQDGVAEDQINLLLPPENRFCRPDPPEFRAEVKRLGAERGRPLAFEEKVALRNAMNVPNAYADDDFNKESADRKLALLQRDVEEAKRHADLVLFVPHVGGQFNTSPGALSRYVIDKACAYGCDAVLAGHSHTTHPGEWHGNCPVYYSLGNVSMSSRTVYSQHETLPQYGLISHLYVEGKKIVKSTYTVFIIAEKGGSPMRVVPVCDYYASLSDPAEKEALLTELAQVTKRVSGFAARGETILQAEYEL